MNPLHRDESAWIDHIQALWGTCPAEVGLGDDACVVAPARRAISTDTLVEGVDFERSWAPPGAIGFKALAANLSDLAAMGARPEAFLLTMGWPEEIEDGWIEAMLQGMHALSVEESLGLLGGDLTRAPGLIISLTVLGRQEYPPLLRSGGHPGDLLFVSGPLGGPAAALGRFKAGERLEAFNATAPPLDEGCRLLDRFFRPPSQTALGQYLAQNALASCCMDISDGLARDLRRLCEASGCGAAIEISHLPVEPSLTAMLGREGAYLALRGGEEQVLLFAADPSQESALSHSPIPLFRVGRLTREEGIWIQHAEGRLEALAETGYDHFMA